MVFPRGGGERLLQGELWRHSVDSSRARKFIIDRRHQSTMSAPLARNRWVLGMGKQIVAKDLFGKPIRRRRPRYEAADFDTLNWPLLIV